LCLIFTWYAFDIFTGIARDIGTILGIGGIVGVLDVLVILVILYLLKYVIEWYEISEGFFNNNSKILFDYI
jgi:hypothetical protein